MWIWDAYTTTNQYPYSQPVDLADVASATAIAGARRRSRGRSNYIRNSVKVVVDAYDGHDDATTWPTRRTRSSRSWQNAFPELFTADRPRRRPTCWRTSATRRTCSRSRRASTRTTTSPIRSVFYGKQDFWALPIDPTRVQRRRQPFLMRPYYVLMRLPGETDETFVLILPFTPQDRQNMVAWIAAKSDPGPDYGDIVSFEFPSGENVDGPTQVFSRINQDARFSAGTDAARPGRVGHRVRRLPRDPDRGRAAVRAARLRPFDAGERDPRAEARRRGERRRRSGSGRPCARRSPTRSGRSSAGGAASGRRRRDRRRSRSRRSSQQAADHFAAAERR